MLDPKTAGCRGKLFATMPNSLPLQPAVLGSSILSHRRQLVWLGQPLYSVLGQAPGVGLAAVPGRRPAWPPAGVASWSARKPLHTLPATPAAPSRQKPPDGRMRGPPAWSRTVFRALRQSGL